MKTLTKKYDYEKVRNGKKSLLICLDRNRYYRRFQTMDLNAKRFNSTPLKYLSGEQMRDIHSAALDVLWNCRDILYSPCQAFIFYIDNK